MEGLIQCSENDVPLSPISFLGQAALLYGEKVSVIYGNTRYSWRQTHERCLKLASALSLLGIRRGHVVAAFAPNIPALYELHFGVPMSGGVLSALNTKLDGTVLATLLGQLEAKAIFVDHQCVKVVVEALESLSQLEKHKPPILILIPESSDDEDDGDQQVFSQLPSGTLIYNDLLSMGERQADFKVIHPENERDPISVSYTSGSTGMPKGVVYSHRAAYLNSLAVNLRFNISSKFPVFLWTVDMFRCNGWCFTWALAALGGTNICIRSVTTQVIFDAITLHKVTHMCGASAILNKIADQSNNYIPRSGCRVEIVIAGALPPLGVLTRVEALGFNISHAYGMTEALGPVTVAKFQQDDYLTSVGGAKYYPQGILQEEADVKDWVSMKSVPADGKTMGEVMFRSNTLMSGYLKNVNGTQEAFREGWYRTGDLGLKHPDGSIQMKDRAVDVIKCGGETISSLEVEAALLCHPKVLEAAVVARPDNILGETPCAFVKLKEASCFLDDHTAACKEELVNFCCQILPPHMAPRTLIFDDMPVSSTGKIQKFVLREKALAMGSLPDIPSTYNRLNYFTS